MKKEKPGSLTEQTPSWCQYVSTYTSRTRARLTCFYVHTARYRIHGATQSRSPFSIFPAQKSELQLSQKALPLSPKGLCLRLKRKFRSNTQGGLPRLAPVRWAGAFLQDDGSRNQCACGQMQTQAPRPEENGWHPCVAGVEWQKSECVWLCRVTRLGDGGHRERVRGALSQSERLGGTVTKAVRSKLHGSMPRTPAGRNSSDANCSHRSSPVTLPRSPVRPDLDRVLEQTNRWFVQTRAIEKVACWGTCECDCVHRWCVSGGGRGEGEAGRSRGKWGEGNDAPFCNQKPTSLHNHDRPPAMGTIGHQQWGLVQWIK